MHMTRVVGEHIHAGDLEDFDEDPHAPTPLATPVPPKSVGGVRICTVAAAFIFGVVICHVYTGRDVKSV